MTETAETPPPSGGTPQVGEVAALSTSGGSLIQRGVDDYTYLESCPECGQRVFRPFPVYAERVHYDVYIHRGKGLRGGCRLWIEVHPGGKVNAESLPTDTSFEERYEGVMGGS